MNFVSLKEFKGFMLTALSAEELEDMPKREYRTVPDTSIEVVVDEDCPYIYTAVFTILNRTQEQIH